MGMVLAGSVALAAPAPAMDDEDWQALAQCESDGNPTANTGNEYYRIYQFDQCTWKADRGGKHSDNADGATAEQPTEIAKRLHAARGVSPCPARSRTVHRSSSEERNATDRKKGGEGKATDHAKKKVTRPVPAPWQQGTVSADPRSNTPSVGQVGGRHAVAPSVTLSSIAAEHHVAGGWHELYVRNRDVVPDPDVIFPGQVIALE